MKKYLLILISLLYLDITFILLYYGNFSLMATLNIFLFNVINAGLILLLTSVFSKKVNMVMKYFIYSFFGVWYCTYYLFNKVFQTPFSLSLLRQSDQIVGFAKDTVKIIISNLHLEIFFFIPLILIIIFRKYINELIITKKDKTILLIIIPIFIVLLFINPFLQKRGTGSIYNLLFESNNSALNIKMFGVMGSSSLDIYRGVFGFEEKIEIIEPPVPEIPKEPEPIKYDYNNLKYTFPKNDQISNFMRGEEGTLKNEYTGIFKGKNLIYIVAESFSEIGVIEDITPTLYKLVNEGFVFNNFYTSNNLSTIGGEFQALTGLYADNSMLSKWREATNYFPFGLANIYKKEGYNTYAYHNHRGNFQDRNKYIKSQGFTNYKACNGYGLDKMMSCSWWPNSDVAMMESTINEYINSEKPFMTYYMTVSGHMNYTRNGNYIVGKNWNLVENLPYQEKIKGYLATQIELDRALEILLKNLEKKDKLKDTVIVLLADHYPYGLTLNEINSISSYKRDGMIEVNSNNLIIYNSEMTPTEVNKVGMSIDVIPTVYNLFGIDYDSRLIIGKDILSTSEGIAIFKDKSWVTNKGTYNASSQRFISNSEEIVDNNYINYINGIVNNRILISKNIILNNYYKNL